MFTKKTHHGAQNKKGGANTFYDKKASSMYVLTVYTLLARSLYSVFVSRLLCDLALYIKLYKGSIFIPKLMNPLDRRTISGRWPRAVFRLEKPTRMHPLLFEMGESNREDLCGCVRKAKENESHGASLNLNNRCCYGK
jgi:hypothetical protein